VRRLDLSSGHGRWFVDWPDDHSQPFDRNLQLFRRRRPYRKIRVLVDGDLLVDLIPPLVPTPSELLVALLEHPLISSVRYTDDGPPPSLPRVDDTGAVDGWAVATRWPDEFGWEVLYTEGDRRIRHSGIVGNGYRVAEQDTRGSGVYDELGPEEAARRRVADWIASQVAAQAIGADLFVTERKYLRQAEWAIAQGTTICSPAEAVALIGLYLRSQDDFSVLPSVPLGRMFFFWVGARELLGEGWRLTKHCAGHDRLSGADSMIALSGTIFQRFARALEARDQVQVATNQTHTNDALEQAMSAVDVVLLSLMGSFDASARLAHRLLQLSESERYAGWQYRRWVSNVNESAPELAGVVEHGTDGHAVLTVVRLLRNSIHGAALQGVALQSAAGPTESAVELPAEDETELLAAIDRLGGRDQWGIRLQYPGSMLFDPAAFVDRLFEGAIELLNALLAALPLDRLPESPLEEARYPQTPNWQDPFLPWKRGAVRLLLGFPGELSVRA